MHCELLSLMRLLDLIASPLPHIWDLFRRLRPQSSTASALRKYVILEDFSVSWLSTLQPWSPRLGGGCQLDLRLRAVLIIASSIIQQLLLSRSILGELALTSQLCLGVRKLILVLVVVLLGGSKRLSLPSLLPNEVLPFYLQVWVAPRYLGQEVLLR